MERRKWHHARNQFVRARAIYQHFAKLSGGPDKEIYNQRVEELEVSIKFCQHNHSGSTNDTEVKKILASVDVDPLFKALKAQINVRKLIAVYLPNL